MSRSKVNSVFRQPTFHDLGERVPLHVRGEGGRQPLRLRELGHVEEPRPGRGPEGTELEPKRAPSVGRGDLKKFSQLSELLFWIFVHISQLKGENFVPQEKFRAKAKFDKS